MKIEAKETQYKGYRFRSRLEAKWAVFFDALGIEWEYEPEGFRLPNGKGYLPDFRLKCWGTRGFHDLDKPFFLYVEVKGEMTNADADKIMQFCGYEDWQNICSAFLCSDCEGDYADCPMGYKQSQGRFNYPVLIMGNIPNDICSIRDVSDPDVFHSYERMNGVNIYQFNYLTIDGDEFAAFPAATEDGRFYLWGDDGNYVNSEDCERVLTAYQAAKAARFEWGETPILPARKSFPSLPPPKAFPDRNQNLGSELKPTGILSGLGSSFLDDLKR